VHVNSNIFRDDVLDERHEALGDAAQDDARIRTRIDPNQLENEIGRRGHPAGHRRPEKLLFRADVAQNRRRRHAKLRSDVGQRRPLKPLYREHPTGGFKKLIAADARRPAHL
jgi:hypothetical protein